MSNIYENINKSLLGLYTNDKRFIEELNEVKTYYEFYEGRPYQAEDDLKNDTGQLWAVKDRDYKPTREIRNLTKKLMKKQGRFMTSVPPTLVLSGMNNEDRELVDAKRAFIEQILEDGKFWSKWQKAFMDCTIGKRVLLTLICELDDKGQPNPDKPLRFRFYTMPEFTYEFDPNDIDKLSKVQIAYQDEATVGKIIQEQRWHKWTYDIREDGYCWCVYEIVDGTNQTAFIDAETAPAINDEIQEDTQVELRQEWRTGFKEIPCKVIINEGLTGDVKGNSDIKDLMDMAMDYNKTISDYRDALRFKMFPQPYFIDVDSASLDNMKIAPNSMLDLKSDPSIGDGSGAKSTAQTGYLEASFNFQNAADAYLTQLKKDMYEIMEQPLPDMISDIPSGKALKMLYYDLITRCEDKWCEWDDALEWLVNIICYAIETFNLYSDNPHRANISLDTMVVWKHNYPIPDDEADTKGIALKEVTAKVRSKRSYIEEFGYQEDADKELQAIMDEMQQEQEIMNAMYGDLESGGKQDE